MRLPWHFQQVYIHGQKLAISSYVALLEPSNKQEIKSFSGDVNSLSNVATYFPSPLYFVAICSNRQEFLAATLESIYLDTPAGQTHAKVHLSINANSDDFIANNLINQSLLRTRLTALALCRSRLCYP